MVTKRLQGETVNRRSHTSLHTNLLLAQILWNHEDGVSTLPEHWELAMVRYHGKRYHMLVLCLTTQLFVARQQ